MKFDKLEELSEQNIIYLYEEDIIEIASWCVCCYTSYCSSNWADPNNHWAKIWTQESHHARTLGRNITDNNGCWMMCTWNATQDACDNTKTFGYNCTFSYRSNPGCQNTCSKEGYPGWLGNGT